MDKRLEALRSLGSDKFTLEMFQEDTGRMVSILSTYLSAGIPKDTLSAYVSVYADKVSDVRNYINKWEQRTEMFREVIDHLQTENFTNAMNMPGASKKEVYAKYLPVVQALYSEKEMATRKANVAKEWLNAYTIIVNALEGEDSET